MKRYPIILFVLFAICLTTIAQDTREAGTRKLSIDSLVLDMSDVSGSVHVRLDANNSPCALIKIHLWDKIKYVEGQIVGEIIDKGSEKWIYVTDGTKRIKIIPNSYLPFEISAKDFSSIISFQGKKTYVLRLQGEIFLNNNKAVRKASDKEPLIPKWVSNVNSSEWLGVSAPCHSPERARTHAICNALTNYVVSKGRGELKSVTKSYSSTKEESHSIELLLAQEILLEGMSFEITREYYNYRGEYFVLCAVVEDKRNKGNCVKLTRQISYNNSSFSGDVAAIWSISFLVSFQTDEERGYIDFSCDNKNMALDIDNKPTVTNQKLLYPKSLFKGSVAKRSFTIEDSGDMNIFSLGIMQSLLYAYAPFAPSTGKTSLGVLLSQSLGDNINGFEAEIRMNYTHEGNLLSFPLQFEFVEDKTLHFSVEEKIFENADEFSDYIPSIIRKESKRTGLYDKYIQFFDHIFKKDSLGYITEAEVSEQVPILLRKNVAFWLCWEQWLSIVSVRNTEHIQYGDGKSISLSSIELDKDSAKSDKEWNIKPLWFMDSNKRDFNHKDASLYDKRVHVAFLRNEQ